MDGQGKQVEHSCQENDAVKKNDRPVVCHISTVHPLYDVRIFHKECRSLADAGYDVHLIQVCDHDHQMEGISIHAIPHRRGRVRRMVMGPWDAYRKVLSLPIRPVLCHFHDPELLFMGKLLQLHGYKVIYDVHENVAEQIRHKGYMRPFVRKSAAFAYGVIERLMLKGMATVHVLESIAKNYAEPKVVVRNLPRLANVVENCNDGRYDNRLVYIGSITRARGALVMLEMAQILRERGVKFSLKIGGPIHEVGLLDAMQAYVNKVQLNDHVQITEAMPYETAQQEIATGCIGLAIFLPTPNNLNSLPNKIFEYMSYGLAVVGSDFPSWKEYLVETGGGVQVNPENASDIADKVEELLGSPLRLKTMQNCGKRAVREVYSWEREENKLIDFYRRIITPVA